MVRCCRLGFHPTAAFYSFLLTNYLTDQKSFVKRLRRLCPEAERAQEMAQEFRRIVGEWRAGSFDAWIGASEQRGVAEFEDSARALRKDHKADAVALKYQWSNRQVEGQISCSKV